MGSSKSRLAKPASACWTAFAFAAGVGSSCAGRAVSASAGSSAAFAGPRRPVSLAGRGWQGRCGRRRRGDASPARSQAVAIVAHVGHSLGVCSRQAQLLDPPLLVSLVRLAVVRTALRLRGLTEIVLRAQLVAAILRLCVGGEIARLRRKLRYNMEDLRGRRLLLNVSAVLDPNLAFELTPCEASESFATVAGCIALRVFDIPVFRRNVHSEQSSEFVLFHPFASE